MAGRSGGNPECHTRPRYVRPKPFHSAHPDHANTDAPALIYQLHDRQRALLRIAVQWERHCTGIRGPSAAELTAAREEWATASCDPAVTTLDPFTAHVDDEEEEGEDAVQIQL